MHRNDIAKLLKAKGFVRTIGTAFLAGVGVPSFSLGDEIRVQSVSIQEGTYIAERPSKMDKPEDPDHA